MKHVGYNVSVGDCSHGGETIVLGFAIINLGAVLLNKTFRPLKFCTSYQEQRPNSIKTTVSETRSSR